MTPPKLHVVPITDCSPSYAEQIKAHEDAAQALAQEWAGEWRARMQEAAFEAAEMAECKTMHPGVAEEARQVADEAGKRLERLDRLMLREGK